METQVFDTSGKAVGKIDLPQEIFGVQASPALLSQSVRVYLANQRQGTASTKSRAEVKASSKKLYRQKGTGRARAGSAGSPVRVGGGIAFGPKPRNFDLTLSKKMRKMAFLGALSLKITDRQLKIVRGLANLKPKTGEVAKILKNLGVEGRILLATDGKMTALWLGGRNIPGLDIQPAETLNTFSLLKAKTLILAEEAVDSLFQKYQTAKTVEKA